jgi:hypothetical protein
MTTYSCETCKFTTPLKSNYTNHLETRKHIKNSSEVSPVKTYDCTFCEKKYSHKQSVTKHLKSCKKKEEVDSMEEMTYQLKRSSLELQEQQNRLEEQQTNMEVQAKRIESLLHKLKLYDSSIDQSSL